MTWNGAAPAEANRRQKRKPPERNRTCRGTRRGGVSSTAHTNMSPLVSKTFSKRIRGSGIWGGVEVWAFWSIIFLSLRSSLLRWKKKQEHKSFSVAAVVFWRGSNLWKDMKLSRRTDFRCCLQCADTQKQASKQREKKTRQNSACYGICYCGIRIWLGR